MPDDVLHVLAEDCGRDAEMFVDTITSVATGEQPEAALPLCLLALAQVQLMGARLGAMEDVVLDERFEADAVGGSHGDRVVPGPRTRPPRRRPDHRGTVVVAVRLPGRLGGACGSGDARHSCPRGPCPARYRS